MNMKRLKQECPVCLGKFKLKDMTETNCHHFFCDDCFFGMLHYSNKKCAEEMFIIYHVDQYIYVETKNGELEVEYIFNRKHFF